MYDLFERVRFVYIANKNISLFYKCCLVFIGLVGVGEILGFLDGKLRFESLIYYTVLSNILVIMFFTLNIAMLVSKKYHSNYSRFKGAVTMAITVTFLIFHFMLRPNLFSMVPNYNFFSLNNIILHYILPIMTITDWILFDEKGKYHLADPVYWTIIPIIYFAFIVIRATFFPTFINSKVIYPYFFINIGKIGLTHVLINVVVIAFAFIILGYVFYCIDHLLYKMKSASLVDKK